MFCDLYMWIRIHVICFNPTDLCFSLNTSYLCFFLYYFSFFPTFYNILHVSNILPLSVRFPFKAMCISENPTKLCIFYKVYSENKVDLLLSFISTVFVFLKLLKLFVKCVSLWVCEVLVPNNIYTHFFIHQTS